MFKDYYNKFKFQCAKDNKGALKYKEIHSDKDITLFAVSVPFEKAMHKFVGKVFIFERFNLK